MRLWTRLLAALVAVPGVAASAQEPDGEAAAAISEQAPRDLVELARDVQRVGVRLAEGWPGYWRPGQRILIYVRNQGALLISDTPPSTDYEPVGGEEGLWWRSGPLEGVNRPFILDHPLPDGRHALLVIHDGNLDDTFTLIFHEQFHGFQRAAFRPAGGGQFVAPTAISDRVAFAAQAELERRLLAAAVATPEPAERRRHLLSYLALRRDRESALPADLLRVERQFEKVEGTARFIDRLAVAERRPGQPLRDLVFATLREDLDRQGGPFLSRWLRGRGYSVGAGLTFLIRELDPAGWRQRIEESPLGLDEHAAELIGALPANPALAEQIRSDQGYAAIAAALGPEILAAEAVEIKSTADFRRLGRFEVALEEPPSDGTSTPGGMGFAAGPRGMVQIGPAQLVVPDAVVVDVEIPGGTLTARNAPFMTDGAANRHSVLLPAAPALNGRSDLAPGEHRFDSLTVEGHGLAIAVRQPVAVTLAPDSITIRYR